MNSQSILKMEALLVYDLSNLAEEIEEAESILVSLSICGGVPRSHLPEHGADAFDDSGCEERD